MAKTKLDENLVAENIRQIIEGLGVSATIEVAREDETFFVDIDSEDSALLIGKHGSNLESLQFILAVRLKTQTGEEDFEVIVDVSGWRRQREGHLRNLAESVAGRVAQSGIPEPLHNLRPSERRVVHMTLSEHPEVTTESQGEGLDRHLVVKPKD
jgi:spoIIIJ-associated protein